MADSNDTHMKAAVTDTLLSYNQTNVQVWFAQLDAIFNAKIKSHLKFLATLM